MAIKEENGIPTETFRTLLLDKEDLAKESANLCDKREELEASLDILTEGKESIISNCQEHF